MDVVPNKVRMLILLVMCSASMGVIYHHTSLSGLWRDLEGTMELEEWHTDSFLHSVGFSELERLIEGGETLLIDARFAADYQRGHLPNALHLPEEAARRARGRLLPTISKQRPIVVYCDNSTCPAARRVAQLLIRDGFANVAVFDEGWSGWAHRKLRQ
jgi:rhodanese-related sulfurtransferase